MWSAASRGHLEREAFRAIITMCRERIMTRARFDTVKTRVQGVLVQKGPLQDLLRDAIQGVKTLARDNSRLTFKESAKQLIKSLDRCKDVFNNPEHSDAYMDIKLRSLLKVFDKFLAVPNLRRILITDLDSVTPLMKLSKRLILVRIAEKLSQYWSSATRLTKIARRYPVVRQSSTLIVQLGHSTCAPACKSEVQSLEAVLRRVGSQEAGFELESICKKLDKKTATAEAEFTTTLRTSLDNSTVHAEVQLIWYLETHPAANPPRTIASHKDACFMCNEFIAFHGQCTIPRSHGRVYPGWRMPTSGMSDLPQRFAAEVGRIVAQRAREVLQYGTGTLQTPFESTLFSKMGPVTTITTQGTDESEAESFDSEETIRPSTPQSVVATEPPVENGNLDESRGVRFALPGVADAQLASLGSEAGASNREPQARTDDPGERRPSAEGKPWQSVPHGETTLVHKSKAMRFYVEYTVAPGRAPRELKFRTQQLVVGNTNTTKPAGEDYTVHDMAVLPEVDCGRDCRMVRLKVGDEMLEVELDGFADAGDEG